MSDFEAIIKAKVVEIRNELAKLDGIHRMELTIKAEGRIDGDLEISYSVGVNYDADVKGNSLFAVVVEAKRRRGWNDLNQPKAISFVQAEKEALKEEIPF